MNRLYKKRYNLVYIFWGYKQMLVQVELNADKFASWQHLQQQTGQKPDALLMRMIDEYTREYNELSADIAAAQKDIAQGKVYTVAQVQAATRKALKDKLRA